MASDNETVAEIVKTMREARYPISRSPDLLMIDYADRIESAHRRDKCEWAASLTSLRALVKELVGNIDYFLNDLDPADKSDWHRWLTKTRMSAEKAREVCKCAL